MDRAKSLETFSVFAKQQFKTETKVWTYLFIFFAVIAGRVTYWSESVVTDLAEGFWNSALGLSLAYAVGVFLFFYSSRFWVNRGLGLYAGGLSLHDFGCIKGTE